MWVATNPFDHRRKGSRAYLFEELVVLRQHCEGAAFLEVLMPLAGLLDIVALEHMSCPVKLQGKPITAPSQATLRVVVATLYELECCVSHA